MNITDASIRFFGATNTLCWRLVTVLSANVRVAMFVTLGLAPMPGVFAALLLSESFASQLTFLHALADVLGSAVPAIGRYSSANEWPAVSKIALLAFWLVVPLQFLVLVLFEHALWAKGKVVRNVSTFKFFFASALMWVMIFWFVVLGPSPKLMASLSFAVAMSESRVALALYGMLFWSWGLAFGLGSIVHMYFLVTPEKTEGVENGGK